MPSKDLKKAMPFIIIIQEKALWLTGMEFKTIIHCKINQESSCFIIKCQYLNTMRKKYFEMIIKYYDSVVQTYYTML